MNNVNNLFFVLILIILNQVNCQEFQLNKNPNQPNGRTFSKAIKATKNIIQDTYLGENQNSSQLVDLMKQNQNSEDKLFNVNSHNDENTFNYNNQVHENSFKIDNHNNENSFSNNKNNQDNLYNTNSQNQANLYNLNSQSQENLFISNNQNNANLFNPNFQNQESLTISKSQTQDNLINLNIPNDKVFVNPNIQTGQKLFDTTNPLSLNNPVQENLPSSNENNQENFLISNNLSKENIIKPNEENSFNSNNSNNENFSYGKNEKDENLNYLKQENGLLKPNNENFNNSTLLKDINGTLNIIPDLNESSKYGFIKLKEPNITTLNSNDCISKNFNESLIEISHDLTLEQINFLKYLKIKEYKFENNSEILDEYKESGQNNFNKNNKFINLHHYFNEENFLNSKKNSLFFNTKKSKKKNPEIKYQTKVDSVLNQNIDSYLKKNNFKRKKTAASSLAKQNQNDDQFINQPNNFYNNGPNQLSNPEMMSDTLDTSHKLLNNQLNTKHVFSNSQINSNQNMFNKQISSNKKKISLSSNLFKNQLSTNHYSKNRFNSKEIKKNQKFINDNYNVNLMNKKVKRPNKKNPKNTIKKVKFNNLYVSEDDQDKIPEDFPVKTDEDTNEVLEEISDNNSEVPLDYKEVSEENPDEVSNEESEETFENKSDDTLEKDLSEEEEPIESETDKEEESFYENSYEFGLVTPTYLTNKFAVSNNLIDSLFIDKNEEKFINFKYYKSITKCITLVCVVDSFVSIINFENYKQCLFSCLVNPDGVIGLYATLKIKNLKETIPIKQKFINILQTTLTKNSLIKGLNSLIKSSRNIKLVLELKNLKLGLTKKNV